MGCGASVPEEQGGGGNPYLQQPPSKKPNDPKEVVTSSGIDRDLDRARQQEELKVKLLLLGAGESGKSTIFKQMRVLYGSPRSDDDLKMYGVVVRSNVITAMRKLCAHLRSLALEEQLASEAPQDTNDESCSGLTPKQAYDLLISHLVDNTGNPDDLQLPENGDSKDWVGESARAGLSAINDSKVFLSLWKPIKTLWEVRF